MVEPSIGQRSAIPSREVDPGEASLGETPPAYASKRIHGTLRSAAAADRAPSKRSPPVSCVNSPNDASPRLAVAGLHPGGRGGHLAELLELVVVEAVLARRLQPAPLATALLPEWREPGLPHALSLQPSPGDASEPALRRGCGLQLLHPVCPDADRLRHVPACA